MSVMIPCAPPPPSLAGWSTSVKRRRAASDSSSWSQPSVASSSSLPAQSSHTPSTTATSVSTPKTSTSDGKAKKQRSKKYQCQWEGCGKSYTRPVRLQEHERSHTDERPFACTECSATYRRDTHLAAHMRTHRPEDAKPLMCGYVDPSDAEASPCERRFWTQQHLRVHLESIHEGKKGEPKYTCEVCDRSFLKHHLLRSHHAEAHCPPSTQPFLCPHDSCSRSFPTGSKLRKHERTHDPYRYLCTTGSCATRPLDQRSFSTWSALQKHSKDAHPLTCPHEGCEDRTFASAKSLREHEARHLGEDLGPAPSPSKKPVERKGPRAPKERSFVCPYDVDGQPCPRAFKSPSVLQAHVDEHHLGLRPFVCIRDGCDYAAARRHTLDRHVRALHGGAKDEGRPKKRAKFGPSEEAQEL